MYVKCLRGIEVGGGCENYKEKSSYMFLRRFELTRRSLQGEVFIHVHKSFNKL